MTNDRAAIYGQRMDPAYLNNKSSANGFGGLQRRIH